MNPFGLQEHQLAAFTAPVLEYLPAGYSAEEAANAEIDGIGSLSALASPDVAAARIDRLGVTVSTELMAEQLLEDGDERTVIAGLRYRNLDPSFPFVAVKTAFRVKDRGTVEALAAKVARAYRGVGVRGFTFWEQPGLDLSSAESWTTVMAGDVGVAVKALERDLPGYPVISWPEAATEVFAEYQQEHQAWRLKAPGLSPFVSESGLEELQEAADQGLLLSLRDERGFAGLVAATISPVFGRPAVCMLEILLAERLRGKGLAPALESTFLAGQRSGLDTVWGQIHADNLPSLRTARKLGRMPVQQEYFVSLSNH